MSEILSEEEWAVALGSYRTALDRVQHRHASVLANHDKALRREVAALTEENEGLRGEVEGLRTALPELALQRDTIAVLTEERDAARSRADLADETVDLLTHERDDLAVLADGRLNEIARREARVAVLEAGLRRYMEWAYQRPFLRTPEPPEVSAWIVAEPRDEARALLGEAPVAAPAEIVRDYGPGNPEWEADPLGGGLSREAAE